MATIQLATPDVFGLRDHVAINASATLGALNDTYGENLNLDPIQSVSVQISGTFVATVTFQVSNDKVTWVTKSLYTPGGSAATAPTAPGVWAADLGARYFRVVVTAYTSGTVQVNIFGTSQSQSNVPSQQVTGTVTANPSTGTTGPGKLEDAASASGDMGIFTLGVRAPATPAAATSAAGDYGHFAIDAEGKQVAVGQAIPDVTYDSNAALTTTSDVALRAAQAAGIRTFVKTVILENTGAAAARVLLRDGTTTRLTFTVGAGQTLVVPLDPPLRGSTATALNAQLGAAGTVTVSTLGYSGV